MEHYDYVDYEYYELGDPLFPPDLFTMEQLRSGAVALYIVGAIYAMLNIWVVCDRFLVPSIYNALEIMKCKRWVCPLRYEYCAYDLQTQCWGFSYVSWRGENGVPTYCK